MSPTILRFPVNPALRPNVPSRIQGDESRGEVVRPALAFWNKDARTMGRVATRYDTPVDDTPSFLPALADAMAAAERLYFGAGVFTLIGRDYHAGLVLQIARLNAALASHGFDAQRVRVNDTPATRPTQATLLLAAALAASARAVASVAEARAKPQDDRHVPNDIALLASGLAALIAAASFTVARQAAHDPVMSDFAAVSGDLLKTLTMKKPTAPQFLKLLGAAEDVLCRLDDASGPTRPALAS